MTTANIELYRTIRKRDGSSFLNREALFYYTVLDFPSAVGYVLEKTLARTYRALCQSGSYLWRDIDRVIELMINVSAECHNEDPFSLQADLNPEGDYIWRVLLLTEQEATRNQGLNYEIEGYLARFNSHGLLDHLQCVRWNDDEPVE